jgi:spore maturation protein CgeB
VPDDVVRRRPQGLLTGNVAGHPASLRVNEGLLGRLQRHAAGLAVMATGKLRILVVNPIYGGSLPTAHHCIRALRALGHQVFTFESEAFARAMDFTKTFQFTSSRRAFDGGLTSLLSQGVEIRARETRPDLILALAQAPILPQTMQNLEQRGIPTAFWFVEDYRVLTYWRDTAPYCSWLFGIQKENFAQELAAIGMERYSYLPTCAAPDVHRPLELSPAQRNEFGSRLSFVGAGYFNRRVFFKGLTDYDLKIWGSEWPILFPLASHIQRNAARIDTEDCVRIFNASEVNLNLHSSLTCDGVVPDGDFVNPRAFEIPACGAFQLVDHRQLLPELFDAGEVETFTNLAEAREKIDRFLAAPDDRRAVAARARRRVLEEHTYEHRMAELLATMAGAFPHLAERVTERTERWDGLMADLDRHEGLAALLERLPDRRWFTLGDVLGTIATGKGAISRAERLFLMLQNVEVLWDRIPE